jgi:serine/threonine protein kinase
VCLLAEYLDSDGGAVNEWLRSRHLKGEKQFGDWIRTKDAFGGGGVGDVFVAYHRHDTARARPHALKQLRNVGSVNRVERFRKEVAAALRLEHPGIVKPVAYDLGAERPYYVAPLYRNGHLTRERAAQMSTVERLRFFASICRAIGHAHRERIVHRDIKPENVLIADDGGPVVADFGLCFFQDDDGARLTETFEVAGSRFFTAPELADGRAADVTAAADVYSLGKLLYWLFSGGRVFEREKHGDPKYNLLGTEPRTTHALVYLILEGTIVEEPTGRYFQDANALAAEADAQAARLEMDAHVMDLSVPQQCHYCRVGEYKVRVDPRWWLSELKPDPEPRPNYWRESAIEDARRYGLQAHTGTPWLVLVCEHCGNVQTFQLFEGGRGIDPLKNWNLKKV